MTTSLPDTVARLLDLINDGDDDAQNQLWQLIYGELHDMAERQVAREGPGKSLTPTSLVHEAYQRLVGGKNMLWVNRRHFFWAAGLAMRRICIDRARKRKRHKGQVPLDQSLASFDYDPAELLAMDEALIRLEQIASRQAEVVTLRFFVGLNVEETAKAIGVSSRTVESDWAFARAWLHRELGGDAHADPNENG